MKIGQLGTVLIFLSVNVGQCQDTTLGATQDESSSSISNQETVSSMSTDQETFSSSSFSQETVSSMSIDQETFSSSSFSQETVSSFFTDQTETMSTLGVEYYPSAVSLVIDLSQLGNSKAGSLEGAQRMMSGLEDTYLAFANITNTNSMQIGSVPLDDVMLNLTMTDVTDTISTVDNTSTIGMAQGYLGYNPDEEGDTAKILLFVSICPLTEDDWAFARGIFEMIRDNTTGLYIKPTNDTTNIKSALTDYLDYFTTINHTYLLQLDNTDNLDIYWNLTEIFCRVYSAIQPGDNIEQYITDSTDLTMSTGETVTDIGITEQVEIAQVNVTSEAIPTQTNPQSTQTNVESTTTTETSSISTDTTEPSAASSTDNATITASTSGGISVQSQTNKSTFSSRVSIGVVVVCFVLALVAVGVVFRKRIGNFVSGILMRRKETDMQMTSIRYGSLNSPHEYDYQGL